MFNNGITCCFCVTSVVSLLNEWSKPRKDYASGISVLGCVRIVASVLEFAKQPTFVLSSLVLRNNVQSFCYSKLYFANVFFFLVERRGSPAHK